MGFLGQSPSLIPAPCAPRPQCVHIRSVPGWVEGVYGVAVGTDEARMRKSGERLRRWEDEIEARERQAEVASKLASRYSVFHAKIGRNERCPCGSGLKFKRCHGLSGPRTY